MAMDTLTFAPETRWVFRVYAGLAAAAGFVIFAWGPMLLGGVDLLGASLVRVAGGVLMMAAAFATAMDRVEDPAARHRALLWFGIGHAILFVVLGSQQSTVWASQLMERVTFVAFFLAWLFLYSWFGITINEARFGPISLFHTPPASVENLQQRYRNQIREAALQEERHRLARDLHDSVKQQIFAIQTSAAAAQTRFDSDPAGARAALDQVRDSAREAMAEMQAMLDQLRAAPLENAGMVAAIRQQCEALGFRSGAKVEFEVGTLPDELALVPGAQEALLRVTQEALSNVARHARAKAVRVVLAMQGQGLALRVEDDGAGFDAERQSSGMGMSNMRARAAEFGGTFELETRPGAGTVVMVTLPVAARADIKLLTRQIWGYGALALLHAAVGAWRQSGMLGVLAVMWGFHCVRLLTVRSTLRRNAGAGLV